MTAFNHILAAVSVVLVLLCMAFPLRKNGKFYKNRFFQRILKPHTIYAVALLVISLLHGIAAGKQAGIISGKAAWMILLVLVLTSFLKRKIKQETWLKLHRIGSVLLFVAVGTHIVYALVK